MAGRGPAPKAADERARANAPQRGEWVVLPPLERPVLPTLPRDMKWSPRARRMWAAWRADWATQVYGPSEVAMALEAIWLFERIAVKDEPARWAEFRQWTVRLGLNLKGKRDLRLRLEEPKKVAERARPAAQLGGLRLVDDAVPA